MQSKVGAWEILSHRQGLLCGISISDLSLTFKEAFWDLPGDPVVLRCYASTAGGRGLTLLGERRSFMLQK